MQVNRYVPHYLRLPSKIDNKDFKMFQYDFDIDADILKKLLPCVEDFDKVLMESLMMDREVKYNNMFKSDALQTVETSTHSRKTKTFLPFKKNTSHNKMSGYDSDEERENSY